MKKNFSVDKYILDDNQMQLLLNNKNSFVIAGAGSGKTLTILGKVNYLIENENVLPENILLISFTNASVNDLKKKVKYNVNIFTFHKLAMYILDKNKIKYNICKTNILKYIINEYLQTCTCDEQKSILKFLKLDLNYNKFLKTIYYKNFCNLIETFINLYKTNNYSLQDLKKLKYTNIEKKILLLIFKIYNIYINEKNSTNTFDFDDLILYATEISNKTKLNFKYIIIDEFQDSSLIRLNLIKAIFLHENSKIIVVGDDWQSIYHFSGCNLNLFLNFSSFFPDVNTIKLINTYRNSQELIQIASCFIQKNKQQIKKNLVSLKHNKNPIILVPYDNPSHKLNNVLNNILSKSKDILILIRNNNDINDYLSDDLYIENNFIIYKNIKIKYMTVHKSKGLEAEYTIILNCNDDYLGFPNKIENNKIINKLFPNEKMPFAEERRLFYVALTRCKETTYILYNKNNPSKFIKELKKIIKHFLSKITYFK